MSSTSTKKKTGCASRAYVNFPHIAKSDFLFQKISTQTSEILKSENEALNLLSKGHSCKVLALYLTQIDLGKFLTFFKKISLKKLEKRFSDFQKFPKSSMQIYYGSTSCKVSAL
jgi:transketolase N-terminal domain/subunit